MKSPHSRTRTITREQAETLRERRGGVQLHINFEHQIIGQYADYTWVAGLSDWTDVPGPSSPSAQIEAAIWAIEKDMVEKFALSLNTMVQMTADGNFIYLPHDQPMPIEGPSYFYNPLPLPPSTNPQYPTPSDLYPPP